jgi:probable F420-dependent oxidoreductase
MQISVRLPTDRSRTIPEFASGAGLGEFARAAEAAGFTSVHESDHPFPSQKWAATGGHRDHDPFVVLAFIASATSTLRIQTKILVLPYRNPFVTAKAAASLDVLSGGRLTLGVGVGYLRSEFAALGAEYSRRGADTDRAISLIRLAWRGEPMQIADEGLIVPGNVLWPAPVQVPGPPIWIAGNSRAALERAARVGDGWIPTPNQEGAHTAPLRGLADLEASIAALRERARGFGRPGAIDVQIQLFSQSRGPLGGRSAGELLDEMEQLADVGVTAVTVEAEGVDRRNVLAQLDWYGREVIPQLPEVEAATTTRRRLDTADEVK